MILDTELTELLAHHGGAMVFVDDTSSIKAANSAAGAFINANGVLDIVLPAHLKITELPLRVECLFPMRTPKEARILIQRVDQIIAESGTLHLLALRPHASLNLIANEKKSDLLRKAAHDLGQPLYSLALLIEGLLSSEEFGRLPKEERLSIEKRLQSSSEATQRIAQQIIDISLSLESLTAKIAPINARDFASDMQDRYIVLANSKGIRLYCDLPNVEILSDQLLLERILGNLLDNAIRHTSVGCVEVSGTIDPDGLQIVISDTGCGIEAEYLAEIFEEFYRIPGSLGHKRNLGLGLSVVADLTAALGHRLTLKSDPGRGTQFKLWVPTLQRYEAPQSPC